MYARGGLWGGGIRLKSEGGSLSGWATKMLDSLYNSYIAREGVATFCLICSNVTGVDVVSKIHNSWGLLVKNHIILM